MREQELFAAAKKLSLHEVSVLDYDDGELAASDAGKVVGDLVSHIRRIRPDVVVTLDPFGAYGHPDHIAISQLTVTAIFQAASPDRPEVGGRAPHQVKKALLSHHNASGISCL